jgi:DNA mismatch endonuclease (patch repair protein)
LGWNLWRGASVDNRTPEQRSEYMHRIGSQWIKQECLFRDRIGLAWRRGTKDEGRADFVFPDARVLVFLDGDFWHGRAVKDMLPEPWKQKLRQNAPRDAKVRAALREAGWCVLSVWETEFVRDPEPFLEYVRWAVKFRTSVLLTIRAWESVALKFQTVIEVAAAGLIEVTRGLL